VVGGIEVCNEFSLLENLGKLSPLIGGGVYTSWVVGTRVEKDDGASLGVVQSLAHSLEVEALGGRIPVRIVLDCQTSILNDVLMVGPGWVADIYITGKVSLDEFETESEGTGTRESLSSGNSLLLNSGMSLTKEQVSGNRSEASMTINGKIFLIDAGIVGDLLLGISDTVEDVWFSVVVSVSTNADVNLLGVLVSLVSHGDTENGIRRGFLNVLKGGTSFVLDELISDLGKSFH